MKIDSVVVGALGVNCYCVSTGKHAYLIDPGAEAEKIFPMLERADFETLTVLLTHAHFDHIGAAGKIVRRYALDHVELADADRVVYFSADNAMPPFCPPVRDLPETRAFTASGDFQVLPMPGHSPGGSAFLFSENGETSVFVGDSVFSGSIGRTDLPGGDLETLLASIRREILTLDDDVILYPGHGEATSVGIERRENPYLR